MLSFTHSQPEENEEIPDNLKDLFGGKKSSLGDTSTISDHSAQSSISEPDDGLPNEELTQVLGLLSEEQAKSRSLQEKMDSMEKQLEKTKELEKELEKTKSKVSELNRRFQDATRAYEQEKRVSNVIFGLKRELLLVRCWRAFRILPPSFIPPLKIPCCHPIFVNVQLPPP